MTARVVAIWNRAGGVGKTTITRDLGYELALAKQRVLLIDADSQGSLGDFLGEKPHEKPKEDLFWEAVCNGEESLPLLTQAFKMDIGLSNLLLHKQEEDLAKQFNHFRFRVVLEPIRANYDFILIDCAPSVSEITRQVMAACDEVLIPVQPEDKGVSGLLRTQETIIESNKRRFPFFPPIRCSGVVPTLVENRTIHSHYLSKIKNIALSFEYPVLKEVRRYVAVTEACNQRKPLRLYNEQCPALNDIVEISQFILSQKRAIHAK